MATPAPAAAPPTATLLVSPPSIQRGQSATLTWTTTDATNVTIDGIGNFAPNGSQQVTPTGDTTYRLIATGPGGTQQATAQVTVTAPAPITPPPTPPATSNRTAMVIVGVVILAIVALVVINPFSGGKSTSTTTSPTATANQPVFSSTVDLYQEITDLNTVPGRMQNMARALNQLNLGFNNLAQSLAQAGQLAPQQPTYQLPATVQQPPSQPAAQQPPANTAPVIKLWEQGTSQPTQTNNSTVIKLWEQK